MAVRRVLLRRPGRGQGKGPGQGHGPGPGPGTNFVSRHSKPHPPLHFSMPCIVNSTPLRSVLPNNATDIEWATHPPTIIIHDDVFLFMKARFVGAFVCTPRPSLGGHSRAMAAIAVLWRHVCHMAGPCVCFLAGAWAAGKPTRWTVSPLLGSPVAGPLALRLNGPPYCRKATEPTVLCQPTVGRITPARRPAYASVA